jgi:SAM-dependent methyltransferase
MSLAAQVLGLGTFWITQMGDREQVREVVGLPYDRLVIAVLAVGFPKHALKKGPRRRPLHHVAHWNHYAGRPIPSSPQPARWEPDQLALYQRARVLNGLRHNKPRAWETRALLAALDHCVPATKPSASGATPRWLDVLPCTGILTERIARERPGYALTVVERTGEVAEFCAARVRPAGEIRVWPPEQESQTYRGPEDGAFELITCLYRLEGLVPAERPELLAAMARWLAPGGRILLGYVSRASFHTAAERLRARRARLQGVEYVLSPDPNIGPFEALAPGAVEAACKNAGLRVSARLGLQIAPQPEEIAFRARNFRPRARKLAGALGAALGALERVPGLAAARGRFRYLLLERA